MTEMILVSGAAGVMGSRLVKGLVQAGSKVRALVLPGDPYVSRLDGVDCEIVSGDITDPDSLNGLFDGVITVYHLAAIIIVFDQNELQRINVDGTRNMVTASLEADVRHFIYISSAAVISPEASDYAHSKLKAEGFVTSQTKMNYTVARPTLVYEKDGGQEFMLFMESLHKYPVVPFVGRGRAKKNPVYIEDIVKGLLAIAGNPKTYGKIYNFSGGETISIGDLARLILKHMGMKRLFIPIPISFCRIIAFFMEIVMKQPPLTRYAISRMEQDADLDNSMAKKDLGYNPIGIREGLEICYPVSKK